MVLRLAGFEDLDGVLSLQAKYLFSHLTESERLKGFVTTPFTRDQILQVLNDQGLFIAIDQDIVVGYVFTGSWDFFASWPIFPHMLSTLDGKSYHETLINDQDTFQYGPVCIDEAYRGQDLFQQLFELMRTNLSSRYPIGLTFINKVNTHSYYAHTRKLGLDVMSEFSFNGNEYYVLAFDMNRSVL